MGSTIAPLNLTLSYLERSRSSRFLMSIFRKRAQVNHMLLLYANRKPCQNAPSYLALMDLENSISK